MPKKKKKKRKEKEEKEEEKKVSIADRQTQSGASYCFFVLVISSGRTESTCLSYRDEADLWAPSSPASNPNIPP